MPTGGGHPFNVSGISDNMKILYYAWKEFTYIDAIDALRALGHEVTVDTTDYESFDEDERLISVLTQKAKQIRADVIFSFNFFPDLSRVAECLGITYMCWCYDSPLTTLESKTLTYPGNRVFLFDRGLYSRYKNAGVDTVYHMPLACNTQRLEKAVNGLIGKYDHDVCFLGNMYSGEKDFYGQIKYLPDYIRGYVDSTIEVAMKIYGADIISETITHEICERIAEYVKFDLGPLYNECNDNVIRSMIQKHTTMIERQRLLAVISEYYKVDHYAKKKEDSIKANYMGYADYIEEMPKVFATSRINLNITLRSIISGIPLRVIDILGSGGFCLTNYQAEIAEYFENDKSIVWYESHEELFEKLGYYMRADSEREEIAAKGHMIVAGEFSYENRLRDMLSRF